MSGILLTQSTTPVIGQIAWLLGYLMDGIYNIVHQLFGVQNIGIAIILFTIVIYMLMLPLTIRQQKSMKLNAVVAPEVKKVQEKYKGKTDVASQQQQRQEMQAVYEKYGASMAGGCLPLLIQMPIFFGLYQVIRNIPAYVGTIKDSYIPLVDAIQGTEGYQKVMEGIGSESPILVDPDNYDYTKVDTLVDVLYKFTSDTWNQLTDAFPSLESLIVSTQNEIENLNYFLGINIAESPMGIITENFSSNILMALVALLIPICSGLAQYMSVRLSQSRQTMDKDNPMASSMKAMNVTMPLFSVFLCFTVPAGMGIYWTVSALVRAVQQVLLNRHYDKIPIEELVKKSQEKAAKKRERKGEQVSKINQMAQMNAKKIQSDSESTLSASEKEDLVNKAKENNENAQPGSLASKANMVKRYNENKE